VVDEDSKKMAKSVGNILNPDDVFDAVGADPLRWYFAARLAPEAQKRVSVDIVADVAGTFINTFWNTYAFFVMYARLDDMDLSRDVPVAERPEIDRWILALLQRTIDTATVAMDNYHAQAAGEAIESFVDQLSNWYVRRNRRRFWKASAGQDKQAAYLTLYECLSAAHRLMAPFMPFIAEAVYQNLVRGIADAAPLSVHMAPWPESDLAKKDDQLIYDFDVVQRVVWLGRAARNQTKLRVRQPLARILVRVPDEQAAAAVLGHEDQILEELNVKSLALVARDAELVSYRIKPNLPRVGKRYGKLIPVIREALAKVDGGGIAAAVAAGESFTLEAAGQSLEFGPEDVLIETGSAEGYACAEDGGFLVGLDTRLNDELVKEGLARELVRTVQDARKQADLDVADRITLRVQGSPAVEAALAVHRDFLMAETLAAAWANGDFTPQFQVEHQLEAEHWKIELTRNEL
jgi:isoleucyl-tRNA synthetase